MQRLVVIGLAGMLLLTGCLPQPEQEAVRPYPRDTLEGVENLLMAATKLVLVHPLATAEEGQSNPEAKALATSIFAELEQAAKNLPMILDEYREILDPREAGLVDRACRDLVSLLNTSMQLDAECTETRTEDMYLESAGENAKNPEGLIADVHIAGLMRVTNEALNLVRAIEATGAEAATPYDQIVGRTVRMQVLNAGRPARLMHQLIRSMPIHDAWIVSSERQSYGFALSLADLKPLFDLHERSITSEADYSWTNNKFDKVSDLDSAVVEKLENAYIGSWEAIDEGEETVDYEFYEVSALQVYNLSVELHEALEALKSDTKAYIIKANAIDR